MVGATGTVSVHIIPSLNFGISAFADQKKANVFVNVDASVSATQGVTATRQTKRDEQIPAIRFARKGSPPIPDRPDHPADHDYKSDSLLPSPIVLSPQPENELSVVARADVPPVSMDGCFEADTSLSVNVGADADFFNLFSATTQVPLFNKTFQLFKVLNQLPKYGTYRLTHKFISRNALAPVHQNDLCRLPLFVANWT